MKMTITSTEKTTEVNGVPARIWVGETERGVPVTAFITRVAVPETVSDRDHAIFRLELDEHAPPSAEVAAWPTRMLLD